MPSTSLTMAPRSSQSARPQAGAPNLRRIAQALLLVIATLGCYLPSLKGGFLWDDRELVIDNPLLKSAAGLWRVWFSTAPYDYYPIYYSSLWLDRHWWGADPLGYRAVNLAWHIGSAFLFWRLLVVWRLRWAWCAALLFALHPLNVASVAWIAERKNVLSMFFYLGTLLCWACAEKSAAPSRRKILYLAALVAFALALGSKSSVVMLPCVLLLVIWWQTGRIQLTDVRRTLPFFGLSLAAGLVSMWFQHRAMAPADLSTALPPNARVALLGKTIWFYLGKAWFPHPLVMIYPRWRMLPRQAADFLPLVLLAMLCGAAGWLGFRWDWRGPAAALGCFCLNLLPVAGLFHMTFYALSYVSDHLAYLSTLSVCALGAAGLASAWDPRSKWRFLSLAATVLVLAACAALTWQRAADFGLAERLWGRTVALNPGSAAAQNNYGLALAAVGRTEAAEACFHTALRLEPAMPAALIDLAAVLQKERRWPEAAAAYRQLLCGHGDAADYNNYGVVLLYLGDSAAAAAQFQQALVLNPTLAGARYNLARVRSRLPKSEL